VGALAGAETDRLAANHTCSERWTAHQTEERSIVLKGEHSQRSAFAWSLRFRIQRRQWERSPGPRLTGWPGYGFAPWVRNISAY